jgi:hypothetical protein
LPQIRKFRLKNGRFVQATFKPIALENMEMTRAVEGAIRLLQSVKNFIDPDAKYVCVCV